MRTVVLLCGPPGAGKSTIAAESGLQVYDRDDPQWSSEKHFTEALSHLRTNPTVQAVVIRSGSTSSARRKAAALVGATHTYVIDPGRSVCMHRVKERKRDGWKREQQGVLRWYTGYDQGDSVAPFPGWDALGPASTPPAPHVVEHPRKASSTARGYGAAHRAERARWQQVVDTGRATCARCGKPIKPGERWDLGHTDDRTGWQGPEHASCNRSAGGRNGALAVRQRATMLVRSWPTSR